MSKTVTVVAASEKLIPLKDAVIPFQPRPGRIVKLQTSAEVAASVELIDARIVCLSSKDTQKSIKLLDAAVASQAPLQLQHLRRVVRVSDLPTSVQEAIDPTFSPETPLPFAILANTAIDLSESVLYSTLSEIRHISCTVPVPSTPPKNQAAAASWSLNYWPTIYRAHNPFGPQPKQWDLYEWQLGGNPSAEKWIAIARQLGQLSTTSGCGENVGAVIVDPRTQRAVAGAGDARWRGLISHADKDTDGNVMAHAALRVISFVAKQRVAMRSQGVKQSPANVFSSTSPVFVDSPINHLEATLNYHSPLIKDGYLCTNLDIYLTHEPCVMCSMAIVHSRMEQVVFAKETTTGGISASRTLGDDMEPRAARYGLWHRTELNWRMMGWQWVDDYNADTEDPIVVDISA